MIPCATIRCNDSFWTFMKSLEALAVQVFEPGVLVHDTMCYDKMQ